MDARVFLNAFYSFHFDRNHPLSPRLMLSSWLPLASRIEAAPVKNAIISAFAVYAGPRGGIGAAAWSIPAWCRLAIQQALPALKASFDTVCAAGSQLAPVTRRAWLTTA
jgi:hypothetical protein